MTQRVFRSASAGLAVLCFLFFALPSAGCDGNGGGGSSALTAEEQAVLDYTNQARTDPQGFAEQHLADEYATGTDNGAYDDLMARDPVEPLEVSSGLVAAARAHARDMAENCGLQHDSCDGTSWADRIHSYYTGGLIAENAAVGYGSGLAVVKGWIIDQGIPSLGHRHNLLDERFEHIGIGHHGSYWVQDFGSGGQ